MLAILLALDLACPWVIVGLNLIFLAVGLGAICGGLLEYNSMYFGFKSLCVMAIVCYLLAFFSERFHTKWVKTQIQGRMEMPSNY